jgi:nitrate reductase NapE component
MTRHVVKAAQEMARSEHFIFIFSTTVQLFSLCSCCVASLGFGFFLFLYTMIG